MLSDQILEDNDVLSMHQWSINGPQSNVSTSLYLLQILTLFLTHNFQKDCKHRWPKPVVCNPLLGSRMRLF